MKSKLESLEEELQKQLLDAEEKFQKWMEIDKEVEELRKNQTDLVTLDIGGKKFQTKFDTLLSVKDTLFYKLVVSKRVDFSLDFFIDRNPKFFKYILTYLRYQRVNLAKLTTVDLLELKEEVEYYEVEGMMGLLEELSKEIKYIGFEFNAPYSTAGSNKIDDLNNLDDRTCMKGICASSPGWIIIELNREIEINSIEIGGWAGNTGIWSPTNGSNATILTSPDKSNWENVGQIPTNYSGNIQVVNLRETRAKYVKFQHNSYLGIGYFKILNKLKK